MLLDFFKSKFQLAYHPMSAWVSLNLAKLVELFWPTMSVKPLLCG